jgi:hypothetical protein
MDGQMKLHVTGIRRMPTRWRYALAGLVLSVLPAWASHVDEEPTVSDTDVVSSTDQLLGALRQFENLPAAARAARVQQLKQLAEKRRARMLALLERSPKRAALRLLPPTLRSCLPAEAR